MKVSGWILLALMLATSGQLNAQKKKVLAPIYTTFKGTLTLPIPSGNPLFRDVTETIGQLDGSIQFPVYKGISLGVGTKWSWYGIEDRALAPQGSPGEVRRSAYYGKVAYEQYTGKKTFYELWIKSGMSQYAYDCPTCTAERNFVFHWGAGASYYIHATDNLSFGLMLGYETDATTFSIKDIGVDNLPGRRITTEEHNYRNFLFGMGFSTTFKKASDGPGAW